MNAPPPYPRIPHLWATDIATSDDQVLPPDEAASWLQRVVSVEEKLDGANVSLWLEDGRIQVASRGGAGAMDRGNQLGRLRAWAAEHDEAVRPLLADGWVLYGEWLWLTHGTAYGALPDWLVVLDCWHPDARFAPLPERDRRVADAGLLIPPRLFDGVLGQEATLRSLLGPSAYSPAARAEGLVLRGPEGERCKVVDPSYRRRTDEEWRSWRHNVLLLMKSENEA